jgi:hypothetical protein
MATCAERARAAGAAALYLHTAPFMTGAVALYDGLGYRRDPATDLDVGAHFGAGSADAVVVPAYRLDLAPACRIVRGGEAYEGRQGLAYDAGFTVIARTDPNEQESVVLMPELDAVPDREEP